MNKPLTALLALLLLPLAQAFAKDKAKSVFPAYVLSARSIYVMIDPDAGETITDPKANQTAQKDVETALLTWGRFTTVIGPQNADLIIVVRRGHTRLINPTITDPRQNDPAGTLSPFPGGVAIGGQHGRSPNPQSTGNPNQDNSPRPQTEIGGMEDSFLLYQGGVDNPLDRAPLWRYIAKDALRPHNVPAVDEFKKKITEAEKAAADKKP